MLSDEDLDAIRRIVREELYRCGIQQLAPYNYALGTFIEWDNENLEWIVKEDPKYTAQSEMVAEKVKNFMDFVDDANAIHPPK